MNDTWPSPARLCGNEWWSWHVLDETVSQNLIAERYQCGGIVLHLCATVDLAGRQRGAETNDQTVLVDERFHRIGSFWQETRYADIRKLSLRSASASSIVKFA